jgi:hypothetical protein
MTVDRTQLGCQTRYTLNDRAGLPVTLTFGAGDGALAEWEILLPAAGDSSRPDVTRRFVAPVAVRLRAWLAPLIGPGQAAELADAVVNRPPRPMGRQRCAPAAAGFTIPRQRDYRT